MGTRDSFGTSEVLLGHKERAKERAACCPHLLAAAPPAVRKVLEAWAAPGDAAPLLPRHRHPAALLVCYGDVAAGRPVTQAALSLLYENARLNNTIGLWADLRREAALVLEWLAPFAPGGALDG